MFEIFSYIKSYFTSGDIFDSYKIKQKIRSGDFEQAFADLKACSNAGDMVNKHYIMYDAIRYGDVNLVKNILSLEGVDVNAKLYGITTPINVAINEKKNDIFKVLLEVEGVDLNSELIYKLMRQNNVEAFKSLIVKKGLDVNELSDNGIAPLHLATAIYKFSPDFLKALLSVEGIDLNVLSKEGVTALELATHLEDNTELVQLLKNAGASMNAPDNFKSEEVVLATEEHAPELLPVTQVSDDMVGA